MESVYEYVRRVKEGIHEPKSDSSKDSRSHLSICIRDVTKHYEDVNLVGFL